MNNNIRVRFAPSPTGYLHIGGLRTVLFNYLIAKSLGGKLILRIEDTDEKRRVEGATESLIDIIDWVGIKFDEGPHIGGDFGPYTQSERNDIYDKHIEKLLEEKKVYKCFCTPERLDKMRSKQQKDKQAPRYDRMCRDLTKKEIEGSIDKGKKFVIRQKMPLEGDVIVRDELRGEIKFNAKELDDHVLIKSSGTPTYQFANVVDDHLMQISHVIRGEEWISSLPKNYLLYKAFEWDVPKFVHPPLILNKGGGKLSKRQGDVAVEDFKNKGYLPEALINFCVLLGWHPKNDIEIYNLDELEKEFKADDMRISAAIFDIGKLDYFNGYYIRQTSLDVLLEMCKPFLEKNIKLSQKDYKKTNEFLRGVVGVEQERLKKLSDITELTKFLFVENLEYETDLLIWKKLTKKDVASNLRELINLLEGVPEGNWTNDALEEGIISHIKAGDKKIGDYLWPMRVSLSGKKASPGPFDLAELLGKEETLDKMKTAVDVLQA